MRSLERFLSRREQLLVAITIILGLIAIGVMWGLRVAQGPPPTYDRPGGLIGVREVRDAFAGADRPLAEAGTPVQPHLRALLGPADNPTESSGRGVRVWIWDAPERARTHQQQLSADLLGRGIDVEVIENVVVSVPSRDHAQIIPALGALAVPA